VNDWEAIFHRTATDDGAVLVVRGEIDLSVASRFAVALEELVDGTTSNVVVDLAGVGFIDSAGVRELLKAQRRADDTGSDLVLRTPSDACTRVLQLSGVLGEFTITGAA
jgi:anti-anti-sigma factor